MECGAICWKDRELDEKSWQFGAPSQTVVDMERQNIMIAMFNILQCSDIPSSIEHGNLQQSKMESEAISDSESCDDQIVTFTWSEDELLKEIQNLMERFDDLELLPKLLENMQRDHQNIEFIESYVFPVLFQCYSSVFGTTTVVINENSFCQEWKILTSGDADVKWLITKGLWHVYNSRDKR